MKSIFLKFRHIFAFAGGLATVAAIIKDVLTPLSVFGVWFFLSTLVLGIFILFIGYFFPNIFDNRDSVIKELWYIPLGTSLILTSIVIAAIHEANNTYGNPNGQLSKSLTIVESLQKQTGVLNSIETKLTKSLELHKAIEANTASIRYQSQELTNSLAFDLNSLHDALLRGDLEKLKSFHSRGYDLSDVKLTRSMVESPLIIMGLRQNKKNYDEVLKLLLELQVIKLDEQFAVNPVYSAKYNDIWHDFMEKGREAKKLSEEAVKFQDFQSLFFDQYGYVFPDSFRTIYESETKSSLLLSFSGPPLGASVSLLTEAQLHNNTKVIRFLNSIGQNEKKDVIYMKNNIKINLSKYAVP